MSSMGQEQAIREKKYKKSYSVLMTAYLYLEVCLSLF